MITVLRTKALKPIEINVFQLTSSDGLVYLKKYFFINSIPGSVKKQLVTGSGFNEYGSETLLL